MEAGLVVAIVAAVAALLVPFATTSAANDANSEVQAQAERSSAIAEVRSDVKKLIERTSKVEEAQRHIEEDVVEVKRGLTDANQKLDDIKVSLASLAGSANTDARAENL